MASVWTERSYGRERKRITAKKRNETNSNEWINKWIIKSRKKERKKERKKRGKWKWAMSKNWEKELRYHTDKYSDFYRERNTVGLVSY